MIFPFTFSFSVPGIINPFSRTGAAVDIQKQTGSVGVQTPQPLPLTQPQQLRCIEGLRSQSITPPVLVSRKRGWEPAFAEEPSPSTSLENSTGYLITGMPSESAVYHEVVDAEDLELPPPAKKRRGLAGSIVSTAISAALIGTAVGLTVYRLWRDHGKSSTTKRKSPPTPERGLQALPPPPPYQENERTPAQQSTLNKQRRQKPHSHSKRTHIHHQNSFSRHRSTRARGQIPSALTATSADAPVLLSNQDEPQNEIEHQMNWFGDKLSVLIAEGKRALGREIVVMSDAKEDEVDDGSGAWEDSNPDQRMSDSESRGCPSPSERQRTPGSTRRRRRGASPSGSMNNSPSKTSPRKAGGRSQKRLQNFVSPLPSVSCPSSPNKARFEPTTASGPSSSAGGYFETGVPQPSRHAYSASTSSLPNPASFTSYPQPPPFAVPSLHLTASATPVMPRRTGSHVHGLSFDSSTSPGWTCGEDLNSFDSPELRDSMEKARQRALMMRASRMSMGDERL